MEDGGIINYFGQTYGWDVFAQGIIFWSLVCFGIACLKTKVENSHQIKEIGGEWLRIVSLRFVVINRSEEKAAREIRTQIRGQYRSMGLLLLRFLPRTKDFVVTVILVTGIYTSGIVVSQVADKYMDKQNFKFYPIKETKELRRALDESSGKDSAFEGQDLDNLLKIITFNHVFSKCECNSRHECEDKNEHQSNAKTNVYYAAKHLLLNDDLWSKYLTVSQISINLIQVLIMTVFVLICLLLLKLLQLTFVKSKTSSDQDKTSVRMTKWQSNCVDLLLCLVLLFVLFTLISFFWKSPYYLRMSKTTVYTVLLLLYSLVVVLSLKIFSIKKPKKIQDSHFKAVTLHFGFMFTAIILLWVLSYAWIQNERELDLKTYGVIKTFPANKLMTSELTYVRNYLYEDKGLCCSKTKQK